MISLGLKSEHLIFLPLAASEVSKLAFKRVWMPHGHILPAMFYRCMNLNMRRLLLWLQICLFVSHPASSSPPTAPQLTDVRLASSAHKASLPQALNAGSVDVQHTAFVDSVAVDCSYPKAASATSGGDVCARHENDCDAANLSHNGSSKKERESGS